MDEFLRLQKLQGKTGVWWYLELTDQWTRDRLKNLDCNQENWTMALVFIWRNVYFKELYWLQILNITRTANCQCRPSTVKSCFPRKGYVNFQTLKNVPLKRGDDKSKSLELLFLRSKGNFYKFNLFTKETQTAVCQSIIFVPRFPWNLLITFGLTLTNPLNVSRKLLFRILK